MMEDQYLDSYWEDLYEMQAPYDDRDYPEDREDDDEEEEWED